MSLFRGLEKGPKCSQNCSSDRDTGEQTLLLLPVVWNTENISQNYVIYKVLKLRGSLHAKEKNLEECK